MENSLDIQSHHESAKQSIAMLRAVVDGETYEAVAERFGLSRTAVERRIKTIAVKLTQVVGIEGNEVLVSGLQPGAKIVTAGGNSTRISNVAYSIDDDSQLVKDARTRAFNDAKDRAQQYAQLSGLNLGKVVSISEATGGTTPTPMPAPRMAMAEAVPLSPGQQTVNFSVTVIWELG